MPEAAERRTAGTGEGRSRRVGKLHHWMSGWPGWAGGRGRKSAQRPGRRRQGTAHPAGGRPRAVTVGQSGDAAPGRPAVGARRTAEGLQVRAGSLAALPGRTVGRPRAPGAPHGHGHAERRTPARAARPRRLPSAPPRRPGAPANQAAPPASRPRGPAPCRRAASQWEAEPGRPVLAARAEPAQSEKSEPNPSGLPLWTRRRCRRRRRRRRRRRLLPPDRVYCPNPKVQFCGPAAASERDDTGVRQVSEGAGGRVRPCGRAPVARPAGRTCREAGRAGEARAGAVQGLAGGGRRCEAGLGGEGARLGGRAARVSPSALFSAAASACPPPRPPLFPRRPLRRPLPWGP